MNTMMIMIAQDFCFDGLHMLSKKGHSCWGGYPSEVITGIRRPVME